VGHSLGSGQECWHLWRAHEQGRPLDCAENCRSCSVGGANCIPTSRFAGVSTSWRFSCP